jgi:hypothetical protein
MASCELLQMATPVATAVVGVVVGEEVEVEPVGAVVDPEVGLVEVGAPVVGGDADGPPQAASNGPAPTAIRATPSIHGELRVGRLRPASRALLVFDSGVWAGGAGSDRRRIT